MRRTVVSAYYGDHFRPVASLTWPEIDSFARRHGHGFLPIQFRGPFGRPPAWLKLAAVARAFEKTDEVLWIDADVLIVDQSLDIEVPQSYWQAMVEHTTAEGHVPNTGVWLLRREMIGVLVAVAMRDSLIDHRWWEQAAIMHEMGYGVESVPCGRVRDSMLYENTMFLPEEWNAWVGSDPAIRPRFRHACGLHAPGQQLETIRSWLQ